MRNHFVWIWILAVLLLINGLLLHFYYTDVADKGQFATGYFAAGDFAAGVFAAGQFAVGVFAAGTFSIGIFSIGIFSIGIFSISIFGIGIWTIGFFVIGRWVKRYKLRHRPEQRIENLAKELKSSTSKPKALPRTSSRKR